MTLTTVVMVGNAIQQYVRKCRLCALDGLRGFSTPQLALSYSVLWLPGKDGKSSSTAELALDANGRVARFHKQGGHVGPS